MTTPVLARCYGCSAPLSDRTPGWDPFCGPCSALPCPGCSHPDGPCEVTCSDPACSTLACGPHTSCTPHELVYVDGAFDYQPTPCATPRYSLATVALVACAALLVSPFVYHGVRALADVIRMVWPL